MELCKKFLDFMATQEEGILTYRVSEMVLAIHSNASYLSKPKACSRAGGHMFMAGNEEIPFNNGAILNISQIIRAAMSSAAEAELGALFINAKTAVSIRPTLIKLGHPQPRTPMQTDNATAHALLTNKILPKALKAMDMRFHWLRCCNAQGQFRYYWRPGTQNLADYFTKHHPATHHKSVRPTILTAVNDPEYRTGDSTKSEGTNNYAQNENFQKFPKIAGTEGTKNYTRNKTSENLQKIAELEGTINTPPSKN
jgi:hypothetical protein